MTTTYPHESALSTQRITVYADTLLSLTKGRQYSNLPCFSNTRILAFIHELTDKQLDYVVARLLQLGHDKWVIRHHMRDSEKIELGERKSIRLRSKL